MLVPYHPPLLSSYYSSDMYRYLCLQPHAVTPNASNTTGILWRCAFLCWRQTKFCTTFPMSIRHSQSSSFLRTSIAAVTLTCSQRVIRPTRTQNYVSTGLPSVYLAFLAWCLPSLAHSQSFAHCGSLLKRQWVGAIM